MGGIGGVDSSTPGVEGLGEILLSIGSVGSPVRGVGIRAGAGAGVWRHWLNNLYIKDNINKFFYQKFLAVGVV